MIPVFSVKHKNGRYNISFGEEVKLIKTGDKTKDIGENTALYTRIIEKQILEHPEQWFWFHRRWKTRSYTPFPDGNNGQFLKSDKYLTDHEAIFKK